MNDLLYKLSRDAEKELDAAKTILREALRGTPECKREAYLDFAFAHPNANQYETTLRARYNKLTTELPELVKQTHAYGEFILAMAQVFLAGAEFKAAADADKIRLKEKREAVALRAKQKAELGVDLQKYPKATGATYKALRKAVEPIRLSVESHYTELLKERHLKLEEMIEKAGSYEAAFPGRRPTSSAEVPSDFWFFFHTTPGSVYGVVSKTGLRDLIVTEAKRRSTEEVEAFAAKLTQKIDTAADGATVNRIDISIAVNRGLWEHSLVDVVLSDMLTQMWYTRIIWNRSYLGKTFNQWLTTRVGK